MSDLLRELTDSLQKAGEEGLTITEMAVALGTGDSAAKRNAVKSKLRALLESGRVVLGHGYRTNIVGNRARIAVFRFVGESHEHSRPTGGTDTGGDE